ncbi:RHS repeat-associated core domain-containing protein [Chryseobacterium sp. Tr-659]|uniref:DUF6443 domain-containing protein n=1 Tax=Chryseobacterium sp. Tr-659 TaxID=2608340 RepID=UPI00141EB865|nr:DUF6443 domain-containing protein [Chryseobacterium sp. Tr-659]NIF07855.1 RHS repeat-associated core domain-containing protein [Chryseobacterium sp. Tr-659]
MKKLLIFINVLMAVLFYSQSLTSSENYIYSRVYLEPVTTTNNNAQQIQSIQYLDGLGRPVQNIGIKASPSGKDIVVPSVYDNNGRQTKSYLPLPVDSQNGAFIPGATGNAVNTYYGVPNAYAEVQVEKSPLARTEKSAAPGTDWQLSGNHTEKMNYEFNAAGIVKRFSAVTVWNPSTQINDVSVSPTPDNNFTAGGYYKAGALFKLITSDEEDNEIHTYTNNAGQKILVRQINKKPEGGTENLDTYYVYDEFGNLSFIIPPKASVSPVLPAVLDALCYQYKYDQYNRLAEKKLPGKEWEFIVYDKQNRPVLSQDGNLRTTTNNFGKKGWMFTKYDAFGRVVYSGFFANTATRESMQTALNNMRAYPENNESTSTVPFTLNGIDVYYTKNAFPTGSMTILSVNYYDGYPAGAPALPAQVQNQPTLSAAPVTITSNGWSSVRSIKTYPTASYVKNIENDNWSSSFIWYDTLGRIIGTYGKNHLGGFTKTETLVDFSGKALETYTSHSRNTSSTELSVKDRYIYNPKNYLSKHYQQINANPEELLSEYTYNDLGQIINKKVGNNLQSIDYTYNIRGWLTGINPNDFSGVNNKLFAYKIKYNSVEGAETPNNTYANLKVKPKYNGGIAEVDWKTAYGANEPLRRYGYVYDGVNRLRAGFFQMDTNPYSKEYSEITDYDLNGNINTLNRTGAAVNGTAEVMDDLTYTYDGNRLSYMKESGSGNALSGYPLGAGQGQTIGYDGNGNMTSQPDRGIIKITYNYLDLPSFFAHTDASKNSSYTYLADGTKVQTNNNGKITDYLDGFQYESSAGTLTTKILGNEEGYFDFINNRYVYQYADHLGNIRLSYTKSQNGGTTILEENNYYPLGLKHAGYNTGDTTNNKFKYLYNSKELQSNGNLDYGWRQYMPDLGRWFGMDQLSEAYHPTSPYAYVMNNPVSFIDPDGRDVRPTSDGFEFTGSDLQNALSYLRNGYSSRTLLSALSAWKDGNNKSDFWAYLGSWNAWGATGGDVGGSLYASTWRDGAKGATPNEIQEFIFTRRKIIHVQTEWFEKQQLQAAWRQPGRAQMIGGVGDFLGIFDIGGQIMSSWKPENRYLAMGAGILAAVALKKPALATSEIQAEKNLASGLLEDFVTVRHHTSTSAVKAIKKSGSINVSSPKPFGVDVEIAPFVSPSKVRLGQAAGGYRGGGYIEFTVPKWGVTSNPYIGGTGNAGRIIVEGRMQLDITTLNPKYVKRWWWPF